MIKSKVLLYLVIFLASAELAWSNMITPSALNPKSPVFYLAIVTVLAGESYVVARFVERHGYSLSRMWALGLAMNLATWSIVIGSFGLTSNDPTSTLLIAEFGIISLEAVLILVVTRWRWVRLENSKELNLGQAYGISLIGNFVSWALGFAMIWL